MFFWIAWAEKTYQPKNKFPSIERFYVPQILLTAWLAPKESNINKYISIRQCIGKSWINHKAD
jgi:hypothetical protein